MTQRVDEPNKTYINLTSSSPRLQRLDMKLSLLKPGKAVSFDRFDGIGIYRALRPETV